MEWRCEGVRRGEKGNKKSEVVKCCEGQGGGCVAGVRARVVDVWQL